MENTKMAAVLLIGVAAAFLLSGCAGSYQAQRVELKQVTMVNPTLLKEGKDGQALYRYVKPQANIYMYTKVLVDPVLVNKDGELNKDAMADYQKLANNAYLYLTRELAKDYAVVQTAEPGTIRIQMAITDADSSKPVRNTLSTFVPIGMVLNLAKYSATGKQAGVGEISAEMKITDGMTGELLAAALDRRVGGKELSTLWNGWSNADAALLYWAQQTRFFFCDMRGSGGKCVKPGSE
jgi:hypothetical protein